MNTPRAAKRPSGRVPELDALRFLAAVSVMGFHYVSWAHLDNPLKFGWLGVQLFFMISGFVILWSALGRSAGEFVASRISRLYPSYWVCLTITLVAIAVGGTLLGPKYSITVAAIVAYFTERGLCGKLHRYLLSWLPMKRPTPAAQGAA